jgi:PAS domain S-box-containing protein
MKKGKSPSREAAELRHQAEDIISSAQHPEARLNLSKDETLRLLHELEVHRIELEIQNAELRRARDEVETALEKYTDLYDFAPVGYFTLDRKGTIRAANLTGATLLGIDRSRLIGRRFGSFVSPEARPLFAAFLEKVFASREKDACETALAREGNHPLFARIEAVASSSGEECRVAVSDFSASKRAEEYRQQLYFLQRLIDTIPTPIFYKDAVGKYLGCNTSFEALIGKTKRDIIGKTIHDVATKEMADILHNTDYALHPEPGVHQYETHLIDDDDRYRDFILNVATFWDHTGKVAGSIEVMTDITGYKEMERMKDEMISAVNHEIRTPMTVLLGYIQFLLENRVDEAQQREFLAAMHEAAERLNGLAQNFLDLQQVKTKRVGSSFRPLAVKPLLEEAAAAFAEASDRHRITVNLPAELPLVIGNKERLHDVISKLISNAIRYSPNGGDIVLGARQDEESVTLWVKDEGIGIPREALVKVFDRFYRVDNTDRRSTGGVGLGLALVREIVRAHGGRVWVESTAGTGSTFYIALPALDRARLQP